MINLTETVALALLNSDRELHGWPAVDDRATIPDSDGYLANAQAAITAVFDWMAEPSHDITAAVVAPTEDRTWAVEYWQAMLAQARKEALG